MGDYKVYQSGLVTITDNKTSKLRVSQSGLIIVQKIKRFVISGSPAILATPAISPFSEDSVVEGDASISSEVSVAAMDSVDGDADIDTFTHAGIYIEEPISGDALVSPAPSIEASVSLDGDATIISPPKVFGRQSVTSAFPLLEQGVLTGINTLLTQDGILGLNTLSDQYSDAISGLLTINIGNRTYDSISGLLTADAQRDSVSAIVPMSSAVKSSITGIVTIGDTSVRSSISGLLEIEDVTQRKSSISGLMDFKEKEEFVTEAAGTGDGSTTPELSDVDETITYGQVTAGGQTVTIGPDGTCTGDCTAGQLDPETGEWITPIEWTNPVSEGTQIDMKYVSGANIHLTTYKVYLDGADITSKVSAMNIGMSQGNIHNDVSITSMNNDLFWEADETVRTTEARIEVVVSTGVSQTAKTYKFLLEKKSISDDIHFTLWGRSLSAIDAEEHADDVEIYLEEPLPAKDLCDSVLANTITWDIPDWVLPAGFSYNGSPMGLIKTIGDKFKGGVVVRCGADGGIGIRKKYRRRPIEIAKDYITPDVQYSRRNIIQPGMSSETEQGLRYTAVEVMGFGSGLELPEIDIENDPKKGEQAILRCFWAGNWPQPETFHNYNAADLTSGEVAIGPPYSPFMTYATAGVITAGELYMNVFGRTLAEKDGDSYYEYDQIEFIDGKASVSKPITEILHFEWVGKPGMDNYRPGSREIFTNVEAVEGEDYEFTKYGKEIRLLKEKWAIAKIAYSSTYQKYYVDNHYVDALIAVFILSDILGVAVTVKMNDAVKDSNTETSLVWGDGITDHDFTTDEIAVFAGTMYLDQNRYTRFRKGFTAAYSHSCVDGGIALVSNDDLGLSGMCYIESGDISFDGPKVTQSVQLIKVDL